MMTHLRTIGLATMFAIVSLTSPGFASKAPANNKPARLIVDDNAKLFSPEAIDKAKKAVSDNMGSVEREVHVETFAKLSAADQKRFDEVKNDPAKKEAFWKEWTKGKLAGEKGLVIVINWEPGHVSVVPSDTMAKFFTRDQVNEVRARFVNKFREVAAAKTDAERQKLRDEAIVSAMEYASRHIPASFGNLTPEKGLSGEKEQARGRDGGGGGMGVGGWVCLAISALLGAWLIVALVRAFAGGGMGGGYGGGGGWGGGFFPSLLGGLFGAAAGMWLYDHFFGGGTPGAHADTGAGDVGGSEPIQDSGNFSDENYSGGDFDGGGGDFGGGDFGGGDFGGGDF